MPSGRKRKRNKHDATMNGGQEEVAWTATRCARLLRPITSRISTLRRTSRSQPSHGNQFRSACDPCDEAHVNPLLETKKFSGKDPEWLNTKGMRTLARIYSTKPKLSRDRTSSSRGGELGAAALAYPSPFVRRLQLTENSDDCADSETADPDSPVPPNRRRYRQLPIIPKSQAHEVEQGLGVALFSLLSQTRPPRNQDRFGPLSLKNISLRKVHSCIRIDNECADADGTAESKDSTSEIYSLLEDLGSEHDAGWAGLRVAVRAHGIAVLCEAIQDGVVSSQITQVLVKFCSSWGAVNEGQELLKAWSRNRSSPSERQLDCLTKFCRDHKCSAFFARLFSQSDRLETVSNPSLILRPDIWALISRSLTETEEPEAITLLQKCVAALFEHYSKTRSINDRAEFFVERHATRLGAMSVGSLIYLADRRNKSPCSDNIFRITSISLQSYYNCSNDPKSRGVALLEISRVKFFLMTSLVLMAVFPAHAAEFGLLNSTELSDVLEIISASRLSQTCDIEGSFAAKFAREVLALEFAARLSSSLTKELLTRLLDSQIWTSPASNLLNKVATALADAFTQSAFYGKSDQAFVARVDSILLRKIEILTGREPKGRGIWRSYEWEGAIEEWIVATPRDPGKQAAGMAAESVDSSDNNEDEPTAVGEALECVAKVDGSSPDLLAISSRTIPANSHTNSPTKYLSKRAKLTGCSIEEIADMRRERKMRGSHFREGHRFNAWEDDELGLLT